MQQFGDSVKAESWRFSAGQNQPHAASALFPASFHPHSGFVRFPRPDEKILFIE